MQRLRTLVRASIAAICFAVVAATASVAQGRGGPGGGGPGGGGPPPGGGMGGGGGMNGGPMGGGSMPHNRMPSSNSPGGGPPPSSSQGGDSQIRPGLQLGPPGRWWDDKSFAKNLKLRPDQQTRMDAIFEQNRNALLSRYQGLQQAESQMEEATRSPALDEATLFSQIDRVAQARADLEKANAHMLLQIRKEMDADQITRLEKHR